MTTTGLSKPQRQHRVAAILQQEAVTSQARLVELLAQEGIHATQATVSRDLDDLGAVKSRLPSGQVGYTVLVPPQDQVTPEDFLRRVCRDWVIGVESSQNIVVARTPPGSAHIVASAIDRAGWGDVAGTVAGDDTVLVVATEGIKGERVAEHLRDIAGL